MPQHDYTPRQALDLVFEMLGVRIPDVAERVREVINEGTVDTFELDAPVGRQRARVTKARPLSDEEALQTALQLLQAYTVELPMCIHSLESEFARVALPAGEEGLFAEEAGSQKIGEPKDISIELQAETETFLEDGPELQQLPVIDEGQIAEQRQNLDRLSDLLNFEDED